MIELTERQMEIWRLCIRGVSASEISRILNVSRQFVHKAINLLELKVYRLLTGVAKANRIEIYEVNAKKGYLRGYSPEFGTDVFITFSAKNGVQVWYRHRGNCRECRMRNECVRILRDEAEERGMELKEVEPDKMAEELFQAIGD